MTCRLGPACVAALSLGLPARAGAQEPVSLRLSPIAGTVTHYRTEVYAWLTTPMLPQGDPALPTFHISLSITRTAGVTDSAIYFTDVTEASRFEMPRVRDAQPQLAQSGDFMRGLRTETMVDPRGRMVRTRVLDAPSLPPDLPVMIRGMQALALAGLRLSLFSLPEAGVSTGDTWSDSVRYDMGADQALMPALVTGGGAGELTFKLDRIETRGTRRVAMLSARGRISAAGQDPTAATTLQVSATGSLELDINTGMMLRSQVEMSGPMATRLGTIPVRIRMTTLAL